RFGTVSRCGGAFGTSENMPLARLGGATDHAAEMAGYAEDDPRLYRGYTGYVTEILDPSDRSTTFTYESYTKRYRNTGFPHANGTVTLSLNNYRLKSIIEPAARYALSYYGSNDVTILPTETDPKVLNNVVEWVHKNDANDLPLTEDRYVFDDETNLDSQSETWQYTTDRVTGATKQTRFLYENYPLSFYEPILTPGRHTVLKQTIETAGPLQTITTTSYKTGAEVAAWGSTGNFIVLPTARV